LCKISLHTGLWRGCEQVEYDFIQSFLQAKPPFFSQIYPESPGGIYGKFERVIHISYKLSTVFGLLSTVLGKIRAAEAKKFPGKIGQMTARGSKTVGFGPGFNQDFYLIEKNIQCSGFPLRNLFDQVEVPQEGLPS
jgi:hypothetical protein